MKNLFIALAMSLSLAATAQAVTTDAQVIDHLSHNVILKTYQDLAANSAALKAAIDTTIANPTQQNLVTAQNLWRAARGSYESSEGFLFGPIDALGIDPMIDTWPLALTDLRALINSNQALTVDFVRTLNVEVLGFHAIEWVLFGEGITSNTRSVTSITPREFAYASAAAQILAEQTSMLMNAWTQHFDPSDLNSPAYIDVVSKPGPQNQYYSDEKAVVAQLTSSMIDILNEASTAKLPDATGSDIQDANASLEESPFSWNSINDFTSNINSVLMIYTGAYAGHTGPGIKDLVANSNPTLANQIEMEMLNVRAAIQNIKGPNNVSFGQAIKTVDGRQRIFAAIDVIKKLQADLENEVAPLMK